MVGIFFFVLIQLVAACQTSTNVTPQSPTTDGPSSRPATLTAQQTVTLKTRVPATTVLPTSMATPASGAHPIKVYFSKFPDSLNNFTVVFPANRSSPTVEVAAFALQLLIAGPTLSERSAGYFSEFNSVLTGLSSCSAPSPTGGPDFTLSSNKKGPETSPGTVTVHLCRASNSPGIGADARILAEISATLKQFSDIKNVVVLTQAGNCFGDESGQNRCLK
jgi:hypothetical protein